MLRQCALRNTDHDVRPPRSGAGSIPSRLSTFGVGASSHTMSQVVERALNARVAPTGILHGHANDQFGDDAYRARPPRLAAMAEVELLSDQFPMPPQQGVGRNNRAQFEQNLAWHAKSLARQQGTLLICEAKRASFEPLAQHPVLDSQILNSNKLLTADPA